METWQSLGNVPGILELDFQFLRKTTVELSSSRRLLVFSVQLQLSAPDGQATWKPLLDRAQTRPARSPRM